MNISNEAPSSASTCEDGCHTVCSGASAVLERQREVFSLHPLVPGGGEVGWVPLVLRPRMHGLKRVAVLGCDSNHNLEI